MRLRTLIGTTKRTIQSRLKALNVGAKAHKYAPSLYWAVYDFSWRNYIWLFESKLARYSVVSSLAGYFVYLGDFAVEQLNFTIITSGTNSFIGLNIITKLRLIYFGSVLLTVSRFIYLWRRPAALRYGPKEAEFVSYGLHHLTFFEIKRLHNQIRSDGHRTTFGKYNDDDWEAFEEDARYLQSGKDQRDHLGTDDNRNIFNFSAAKEKHENVIRQILKDRYAEYAARRKFSLLIALSFGLVGVVGLLLPSVDLFVTLLVAEIYG